MARAQPAQRYRPVLVKRVERESDLRACSVELLNGDEHIRIARPSCLEPQFELHVTCQLCVLRKAIVEDGSALVRIVANLSGRVERCVGECCGGGVQPELSILGARNRPLRFGTLDCDSSALSNLKAHGRPRRDLRRALLQKMIEKFHAPAPAFGPVVMGPFLLSMHIEPFARTGDSFEHFQRAARVQALIRPARNDKCGHPDRFERDFLRLPVSVPERMGLYIRPRVLSTGQRETDVVRGPRDEARLGNAAMGGELAVPVRKPFPGIDRGQRRRRQGSGEILNRGEVRDACHADLAIRPRLRREPFDCVPAVLRLDGAVVVKLSLRQPRAAGISTDDCIAALAPEHRVGRLERSQRRQPLRIDAGCGPEDMVRQAMLAVGTPGQKDRQISLTGHTGRPVDIDVDTHSIAQRQADVALDEYAQFDA